MQTNRDPAKIYSNEFRMKRKCSLIWAQQSQKCSHPPARGLSWVQDAEAMQSGMRTTEPEVFLPSRSACACAAWDKGYLWFMWARSTPAATLANTSPAASSSSSLVEVYCIRDGLVRKRDLAPRAGNGTGSGVPDDCPKLTMNPRGLKHSNDPWIYDNLMIRNPFTIKSKLKPQKIDEIGQQMNKRRVEED